jgi:hypothetical protein
MRNLETSLGIATVLLTLVLAYPARAGEGCDGPVFVPGSATDSCGPCVNGPLASTCPGSTTTVQDYYTCGGNTTLTCDTMQDTVGHSGMPCTRTYDAVGYGIAFALWYYNMNSDPPIITPKPTYCQYTTCTSGTTGGTPITRPVYTGSDGTCTYAGIERTMFKEQLVRLIALEHRS